jgi:uncharacterized protein (UPF0332 family)
VDPFDQCVARGRLKPAEPDAERIAAELQTALAELERARACFVSGNWDETATQAYFAMYRSARAAIHARGYVDTNLFGLCVGLERLFIVPEGLSLAMVRQLREAKDVKDAVYAGHRATSHQARAMLLWSQSLAKMVISRVRLPGFDPDSIDDSLPEPPDPGRGRPLPDGSTPPRGEDPPFHRR